MEQYFEMGGDRRRKKGRKEAVVTCAQLKIYLRQAFRLSPFLKGSVSSPGGQNCWTSDEFCIDNMLVACLLLLLLPLLPLVFQKMLTGKVEPEFWFLAAGMYALGLGIGSDRRWYFGTCLI